MEDFDLKNVATQTQADLEFRSRYGEYFENSSGSTGAKLDNFPRFISRQSLSTFLAKTEIYKNIVDVHGSVIECGVFAGGGMFTWSQLSSIFEPLNHNRKIIGFDTFEGFPELSEQDGSSDFEHKSEGSYEFRHLDELEGARGLHDINRPIGHIPKIEFVKGRAEETIPKYLEENKHLIVSLLYLDFDLFEPTKVALEYFIDRMPKGAIIGFDELNQKQWPGETMAVLSELGIKNLEIKRFHFAPSLSYAVVG